MAQTTKEYVRGLKVRYTKQLIDLKMHKSLNGRYLGIGVMAIDAKINLLENIIKDLDVV